MHICMRLRMMRYKVLRVPEVMSGTASLSEYLIPCVIRKIGGNSTDVRCKLWGSRAWGQLRIEKMNHGLVLFCKSSFAFLFVLEISDDDA